MKSVAYFSILLIPILAVVPKKAAFDPKMFYFDIDLCKEPGKEKQCRENIKHDIPDCRMWLMELECLREGECPEDIIAKNKKIFETDHKINCDDKPEKASPDATEEGDNSANSEKRIPPIILLLLSLVLIFK